ncbi:MAG: radical SAM protein [Acidobacteriia bacterium]|nr:radical SAM protein [Terriglobia bacterium]
MTKSLEIPRKHFIEQLIADHPTIPPEAIVKEDLLRGGVAFSDDALRVAVGMQPKSYFIFSFDMIPIKEMGQRREDLSAPEEICLTGGPGHFRRTIVSVRINPHSPYRVEIDAEGRLVLAIQAGGNGDGTTDPRRDPLCEVQYRPRPSYYDRTLSSGRPLDEVAPNIEWGYLLYLTVYRKCQYFGFEEECQFCDINENYRQQISAGRPYQIVKTPEEILEALAIIAETDQEARAYTVTGGSITSKLRGQTEADFYERYPLAIEKRFPRRWISKLVVQALPLDDVKRFKDAGVQIYHPNYEIWDDRLFGIICAGKNRYVGREEWHRRIVDAAGVFGPDQVIPNFVAGIEMAKPYGFHEVEDAIASTAEGLEFFMSQGIKPRFTTWCPEPLSVLGKTNPQGAPLLYHVRLLETYHRILRKYKLTPPPGYGEPGIGKAVFSVSAFMDCF